MAEKVVRSRTKRRRRLAKTRLVIGANWRRGADDDDDDGNNNNNNNAVGGQDNGGFVDEDGGASARRQRETEARIARRDDDDQEEEVEETQQQQQHADAQREISEENTGVSVPRSTHGEESDNNDDDDDGGDHATQTVVETTTTTTDDSRVSSSSSTLTPGHVTISPKAELMPANQSAPVGSEQQSVGLERSSEESDASSSTSILSGSRRASRDAPRIASRATVAPRPPTIPATTTTTTTVSSWSLPCKLSGEYAASRGQRKKSRSNGVDNNNDDPRDEERQRRAQCFYRYRNLHPRAVAYLFARQNGEPGRTTGHSRNPSPHYANINNINNSNNNNVIGGNAVQSSINQSGVPPSMGRRGETEVSSSRTPRAYSSSSSSSHHHHHHHHHGSARPTTTTTTTAVGAAAVSQESSPPHLPSRPLPLPPVQSEVHGRGRGGRSRRVGEQNGVPTTPAYHPPPPPPPTGESGGGGGTNAVLSAELLPDILNSHVPPPPPYSTLPTSGRRGVSAAPLLLPTVCPQPPAPPSPPHRPSFLAPGLSFIGGGRRHRGSSRRRSGGGGGSHYTPDDEPKHCCGVVVNQSVSIRWFILLIAFVGLCCAIVGTVLGALKATGREHLTVSLLMIGVGIVLITVSGIAWRLTSTDAPSCRMMLGFHSADDSEPNRRFVPRVPPSYGRSHHPYAAMMYPEFQYRPPPPSYQASMQEYRLRLLLLDRQHTPTVTSMSPVSPPPTYRSHASGRPPLAFARDSDYSRPPSYRSRSSSVIPRPVNDSSQLTGGEMPVATGSHSRDPSLSLSCLSHESLFNPSEGNGISGNCGSGTNLTFHEPETGTLRDFERNESNIHSSSEIGLEGNTTSKVLPANDTDDEQQVTQLRHSYRKTRDSNAVTIVQTTDSMQVLNPDSVVVTVPGQSSMHSSSGMQGEVEILAHL